MPLRLANAFRPQRSAQDAILEAVAFATEHGVLVAIVSLGETLALFDTFGKQDCGDGGGDGDGDGGDGAGFGHVGWVYAWITGWFLGGGVSDGEGCGDGWSRGSGKRLYFGLLTWMSDSRVDGCYQYGF